jgi:peptidase M23-like protein
MPAITNGYHAGHPANDYGVAVGTPLGSPEATRVLNVRDLDGTSYGLYVILGSSNRTYLIAHLSHVRVVPGQKLARGEYFGDSGNSGNVHISGRVVTESERAAGRGAHVHFEVKVGGKYVNPTQYVGALFSPTESFVGPIPPGQTRPQVPVSANTGSAAATQGALAFAPPGTYTPGTSGFESLMRAPRFAAMKAAGVVITSITVQSNGDYTYTVYGRPGNIFGKAADFLDTAANAALAIPRALALLFSLRAVYVAGGAVLVILGIVFAAKELGVEVPSPVKAAAAVAAV